MRMSKRDNKSIMKVGYLTKTVIDAEAKTSKVNKKAEKSRRGDDSKQQLEDRGGGGGRESTAAAGAGAGADAVRGGVLAGLQIPPLGQYYILCELIHACVVCTYSPFS